MFITVNYNMCAESMYVANYGKRWCEEDTARLKQGRLIFHDKDQSLQNGRLRLSRGDVEQCRGSD